VSVGWRVFKGDRGKERKSVYKTWGFALLMNDDAFLDDTKWMVNA